MSIVDFVVVSLAVLAALPWQAMAQEESEKTGADVQVPALPDKQLVTAYQKAATQNVLAAVNPRVFPGYFCVCADGQGFGFGNSYPSLDGHQMIDALLWLGDFETVKLNWDYVRKFQQPNGRLPLAILPSSAGQRIGPPESQATVDANGGLYEHWVPGNPLSALASPTFIQNADVIYRHTRDGQWLRANIDAVNLAADYLTSLTTSEGVVQGAGYYVERPTRIASDGVAQCHAVDAYRRVAALNRLVGNAEAAARYEQIAARIADQFTRQFWTGDHFAEYLHPTRGLMASHGLTDVDWAALATATALPAQEAILWPRLRSEPAFYYGGMPTGISTRPDSYEDWEFSHPDRHDLAAMGRVWYLEAWARSRLHDSAGLLDTLHRVAREGERHGYYWRERYYPSSTDTPVPAGAEKYCEYAANLIRVVNKFLLGIDLRLDGSIWIAPVVSSSYWDRGFGRALAVADARLDFRLQRNRVEVTFSGSTEQRLGFCLPIEDGASAWKVATPGGMCELTEADNALWLTLPASSPASPTQVIVLRNALGNEAPPPGR